jgi:hypothetical protein
MRFFGNLDAKGGLMLMRSGSLLSLLMLVLATGMAGCLAQPQVQYRVFETSQEQAERVVPTRTRTRVADSRYTWARISDQAMGQLLEADPTIWGGRARPVGLDKMTPIGWAHAAGEKRTSGAGGGVVTLQRESQELQLVVDAYAQLAGPANASVDLSGRQKLTYTGPLGERETLIFLGPSASKGEQDRVHAITFQLTP